MSFGRKDKSPMSCRYLTILLLFVAFTFVPFGTTHASKIYKCVNDSGATSYSQNACENSKQILISIRGNQQANDQNSCRMAQKFVLEVADKMRGGMSSGDLFNSYGGLDSIESPALSLINYVYTYQKNYLATSERIAALAGTRCSAGSFGPVTCTSLPFSYTNQTGGCSALPTANNNATAQQRTRLASQDD